MPRPRKCRRVEFLPGVTYFKPAGIPMRSMEEIQLSLEEAEALRLKDLEGMEQEPAAERMNISRPTFQRVLSSARRKVADVLLNGKAVRIAGGTFEMAFHKFRCRRGHEWDTPFQVAQENSPVLCPTCNTPGVRSLLPAGPGRRGQGRGGRRMR